MWDAAITKDILGSAKALVAEQYQSLRFEVFVLIIKTKYNGFRPSFHHYLGK